MKEFVLQVNGIMCHQCVKKIEDVLLNNDGIEAVGVSEDYKSVRVLLDKNKIMLYRLVV